VLDLWFGLQLRAEGVRFMHDHLFWRSEVEAMSCMGFDEIVYE